MDPTFVSVAIIFALLLAVVIWALTFHNKDRYNHLTKSGERLHEFVAFNLDMCPNMVRTNYKLTISDPTKILKGMTFPIINTKVHGVEIEKDRDDYGENHMLWIDYDIAKIYHYLRKNTDLIHGKYCGVCKNLDTVLFGLDYPLAGHLVITEFDDDRRISSVKHYDVRGVCAGWTIDSEFEGYIIAPSKTNKRLDEEEQKILYRS